MLLAGFGHGGAMSGWHPTSSVLFAAGMKHLRHQLSLTQADLAERAGLSFPTINQLELARRSPDMQTLEKIAHALGTDVVSVILEGKLVSRPNPTMAREFVATRLEALRFRKGWSIRTLAANSSISPSYLSSVLRCDQSITIDKLYSLCWALEVGFVDFFLLDEKKSIEPPNE